VFVEGSQEFVFFQFYRNFSQEFLWAGIPVGRNSCGQEFLYLLRIPEDSGGFLFPPNPPEDLP
jgi:hypothetical protein